MNISTCVEKKQIVNLLIAGELELQVVITKHVPHRSQLANQLSIHIFDRHRGVLEPFAYIRWLTVEIVEIVEVSILSNKRMAPYLLKSDTSIRIDLQHPPDQIFGFWAEEAWHL